jgi:hypothetical protein
MHGWFLVLMLALAGWLTATTLRLVRCYRELYDDFGARRCLVHEEWRRHCIVAMLKTLLLVSATVVYAVCSSVGL